MVGSGRFVVGLGVLYEGPGRRTGRREDWRARLTQLAEVWSGSSRQLKTAVMGLHALLRVPPVDLSYQHCQTRSPEFEY